MEKVKLWGTITKDAYVMEELKKHPEHLTEIELSLSTFEFFVRDRLKKLGIVIYRCRDCGKEIFFLPTQSGKKMPITYGLISHFADCPHANKFRKNEKEDNST